MVPVERHWWPSPALRREAGVTTGWRQLGRAQVMARRRSFGRAHDAVGQGEYEVSWRLELGGEARPSKLMASAAPPAHAAPSRVGPEISASGGCGLLGACAVLAAVTQQTAADPPIELAMRGLPSGDPHNQ